ncbi:MAG: heavy metal transporter [Betaproteobacteria bacterium RIFCSPLOWO2_02_67_12]|nr:MAG: heavy metal transporter [Betaproteobacteria bacterium RIFCSPLOWO2_02_67_12]OGA31015.1 MAG: heavy metal transporter [Betaproteobacteria bacterium RIFCSPLOWO2_02_FULL_68_150]
METLQLKIEGMHCDGCVRSVTRMLSAVPGVDRVEVSLAENKAGVSYDPAKTGVAEFKRAVERAGFKAP